MNSKIIPNDTFFASVEKLLSEGRTVEIRVKGFSMRPFLCNERDSVRLRTTDPTELCAGEVVLFRNNGHYGLHRLKTIDGGRLTFEGDGNYRSAEYVQQCDVVAVVDQICRKDRTVDYGTAAWRRLSSYSLTVKTLRTKAIDIKHFLKI